MVCEDSISGVVMKDENIYLTQHAQTKKPMNIRCADYRISAS